MRFTKKKLVVVGFAVAALVSSGTALAYWTQSGTGTGSATAGTTTGITVNQTSVSASALYPGGTAEALSGTFTNPNASPVNVSTVAAVVSSISGGGTDNTKPACTTADFAIGGSSGPYTVAPGTLTAWSGLTVRLVPGTLNQDNCKNATANITYTANP